jgi:uncharacterized protein YdgA (DUF945 family)
MKKIIITIVVLAGLALGAASPYWFGQKMEAELRAELAHMKNDPNMPPWLDVKIDKYARGWLSSTAMVTTTIDMSQLAPPSKSQPKPPPSPKPLVLNFENDIRHGPFVNGQWVMAMIESRLVPSDEMADVVKYYFQDQPPFSQTTLVQMDGHYKTEFQVPPFNGRDHLDQADIRWQGLKGTGRGDMQSQQCRFEGSAPLFERVAGKQKVLLKLLVLKWQGNRSSAGLMLGDGSFSLGEMNVAGAKGENISIKGFKVLASSHEDQGLLAVQESFGFGRLAVENQFEMGPGKLEIVLRNIDQAVVSDMQRQVQQLQSTGVPPEQMGLKIAEMFKTSGATLLKSSPEFELSKLNLTTAQGDVSGKVLVSFDGSTDFDINVPPSLVQGLKVDAQASVPTVLLKRIFESKIRARLVAMEKSGKSVGSPEEVEQYVQQMTERQLVQFEKMNFIVPDGKAYRSHLKFANGSLTLNDKPADYLLGGNGPNTGGNRAPAP